MYEHVDSEVPLDYSQNQMGMVSGILTCSSVAIIVFFVCHLGVDGFLGVAVCGVSLCCCLVQGVANVRLQLAEISIGSKQS